MPHTSVIITTHNRPHLLGRAVASAHGAGKDVEVIVVDDASTDETAPVCRALTGIKYQRTERNLGVAGARNVGLLMSSGSYVTFLDDDDVRLPNSLDAQVKLLEADDKAGLIYGQAIYGDQSGEPSKDLYPRVCPEGDIFWQLLAQNFIPCGSAVFRRSCLDAVGLLDDGLPGFDDWDLWLRIAELFPVVALEQPVMIWRRSTPVSGQGTSNAPEIASRCVRQFRQWLKLPRAASAASKLRREAWLAFSANIAEHLMWNAMRSLEHAKTVEAIRSVSAAVTLCPLATVKLASRRNVLRLMQAIDRKAGTGNLAEKQSLHQDRTGVEKACG
ncbi:MAG TPA: glycosyltransferase family A protein [Pyrinomonadaceae bacterium]|jgi:glycosyltransferase involved in cell wall biosynthesis|nr:glycosyltransferase family A protein [Pyrinomonadaceae bacterium]